MNRGTLIALGACLVIVGVVLRGLARSNRRDQAFRKQHDLAAAEPDAGNQPDAFDRHLEKWLPRYAAFCIAAGFLAMLAALWLG
ncbi:MAG: hypothetical protein ACOZE5_15460 [Verrucomicrobiota bacterium]